jgi:hypothetical protein
VQRAVANAKAARKPLHGARLANGLRSKPMIDSDREQSRAPFQRRTPARRKDEQRGGIGTAGNGKNESGSVDEVGEQRFRFGD